MFDVGVILVGGAVTQLPARRASGHSDAACVLLSPGQCSCRVASPSSHLKPLHWSRGQSERRNTPPRHRWRCRTQLPKLRGTASHHLGRGDTRSPRPATRPLGGGLNFSLREAVGVSQAGRWRNTAEETARRESRPQHDSDVPFSRC